MLTIKMRKNEVITLSEMFKRLKKIDRVYSVLDNLTFFHIFLAWALVIVIFGLIYYFLPNSFSYLLYSINEEKVSSLYDSVYYSFITATSTGFGDIIPYGIFKVISIVEVIFGLLLLAFVTSKLVSIKQNVILDEIYEMSFNERLSRLRASLLLFRQNLNRIVGKIEDGSVRNRDISDLYIHLSSLENMLHEILTFFGKGKKSDFTKAIDNTNTELLFNSVLKSFEKLDELIVSLNNAKTKWKRDITIDLIKRCIDLNAALFGKLDFIKNLQQKTISDFNNQKKKVTESIINGLGQVEKEPATIIPV